jgi:hypothetical protein
VCEVIRQLFIKYRKNTHSASFLYYGSSPNPYFNMEIIIDFENFQLPVELGKIVLVFVQNYLSFDASDVNLPKL